jgi:hypothetical protein
MVDYEKQAWEMFSQAFMISAGPAGFTRSCS